MAEDANIDHVRSRRAYVIRTTVSEIQTTVVGFFIRNGSRQWVDIRFKAASESEETMRFWTKLVYGAGVGLITVESFLGGAKVASANPRVSSEYTIDALRDEFYRGSKVPHPSNKAAVQKADYHAFQMAVEFLRKGEDKGEGIPMEAQKNALRIIDDAQYLRPELFALARAGLKCVDNYDNDAKAALTKMVEDMKPLFLELLDFRDLFRMEDLAKVMIRSLGRPGEETQLRSDLQGELARTLVPVKKHELRHRKCMEEPFRVDRSDTYGSIMQYKEDHGHWPP